MAAGSRADRLDRTLDEHGDALFDFALAVTGDPERATEAVCQAVPAAVAAGGPAASRAALLNAVLEAALRQAEPPGVFCEELFQPGRGSCDELQQVARTVTLALDPRRRAVLDLSLRHGLDRPQLSEALGLPPGLVTVTTRAAVDEAEQLVGAVLLARLGQHDCPELVEVLEDPAVADCGKRAAAVNQHLEECPTCADRRRALVPATSLLASRPPEPAPPELRRRLLEYGWPRPSPAEPLPADHRLSPLLGSRRGQVLVAGLALALAAAIGLAVVAGGGPKDRPAGPVAAGRLVLRTMGPLDFGTSDVNRSFQLANTGREALRYTLRPGAPWLRAVGAEGTLAPGQEVVVGVAIDRTAAPEGAATSELRVRSTGGSGVIPVRAGVERPPALSGLEATPQMIIRTGCPGAMPAEVRAMVVEESGTRHVEVHWRGPQQAEQVSEMVGDRPSSFVGSLGPFPAAGEVTWWITATDVRGNSATSAPESLRVSDC